MAPKRGYWRGGGGGGGLLPTGIWQPEEADMVGGL